MIELDNLNDNVRLAMLQAANQTAPNEMCGFLLVLPCGYEFVQLTNVTEDPRQHFEISSDDWLSFQDSLVAIVHSHPNGEPFLSGADRQAQVATGLPWILVTSGSLKIYQPVPHLRGRDFIYDKSDCYRLIQDAYHLAGIRLPEVPRTTVEEDAANRAFEAWVERCGFHRVALTELQAGDGILTSSYGRYPDHAMLYLGEGQVLHHSLGQLSRQEYYSEYLQQCTHSIWRHCLWQPEMMAAIKADLLHSQ